MMREKNADQLAEELLDKGHSSVDEFAPPSALGNEVDEVLEKQKSASESDNPLSDRERAMKAI
jgi:hypothetical protein